MIHVISQVTNPYARAGEVVEVDEKDAPIRHYLTVGVLTEVPRPKRKRRPRKARETPLPSKDEVAPQEE